VCRVKRTSPQWEKQDSKRNAANKAYHAAHISQHLQQRHCLQVLPQSRTLLQSSVPSQKNITAVGKTRLEKKCRQQSLSRCSHLSTPAAAPVLAGAAPKPNPPESSVPSQKNITMQLQVKNK
jgi:hypothetical protein